MSIINILDRVFDNPNDELDRMINSCSTRDKVAPICSDSIVDRFGSIDLASQEAIAVEASRLLERRVRAALELSSFDLDQLALTIVDEHITEAFYIYFLRDKEFRTYHCDLVRQAFKNLYE